MSDLATTIEPWTIGEAGSACGADLSGIEPSLPILGITTDSRTVPPTSLFVAIRGERFDGHEYARQAVEAGAAAVLVERGLSISVPQLIVPDVIRALGSIALAYRRRFQPRVAALTGSSGKTTTKDFLASICRLSGETLATIANLNNNIGVPMMLFRLTPAVERAVIELGMNHPGENRELAAMTEAHVGILTSVGPSHLEGVGDEEGVLNAEAELIDDLNGRPGSVVVLDADTPYFPRLAERVRGTLISVGESARAVRRIDRVEVPGALPASFRWQERPVRLRYAGRHNVANAAMAAAAAEVLGCSLDAIVAGLEAVEPRPNRSRVLRRGGITILDDCYNANPLSFSKALELLAATPASRRVVLFADMRELGPESPRYHRELGDAIARAGVRLALWRGEMAVHAAKQLGGIEAIEAPDNETLAARAAEHLRDGDVVLVKASHGMRLDQVVDRLLETLPE